MYSDSLVLLLHTTSLGSDMNYVMGILCCRNSIFSWAVIYLDRHRKKNYFLRELSEICFINIKAMSPEC